MIGRMISEYRIIEKLGAGGMGIIYKAEDTKLKHIVALKFLPPELIRDPGAKERFLREAQAAFALDHPNICRVHSVRETDDGQMFIVMAYYEGETLKKKIERGAMDFDQIRTIIVQTAQALAYAHAYGIIHRDIKPANIIITNNGVAKVLDFGLAQFADQTKVTHAGSTVGTAAYMSPEQARGETIDFRTDIWSIGTVLYEMLTGQPPFKGEYTQVVLYSVLNVEPTDVAKLRSRIPNDLRSLCLRCLEKDRSRRPQSMADVLELLGEKPLPAMRRVVHPLRRSPRWRMIAVVSAIVFVVMVLWRIISGIVASTPEQRLIAVLPFRNLTGMKEVSQWREALQSDIDHEFKQRGIYPFNINTLNEYFVSSFGTIEARPDRDKLSVLTDRGISYLLDGNIGKAPGGYTLQMEVQDLVHYRTDKTDPVFFSNFDSVGLAVQRLLFSVQGFLRQKQISTQKENDIAPWLSKFQQNIEAHKAFMEACEYIYRVEPGGEIYLQRALDLDSLFITPRVWIISSLVSRKNMKEAAQHYEFLRRHQKDADAFEHAMIEWCGAFLKGDREGQIRYLRTALEFSPGNNILLYNLARLRYLEEDWQGTIDLLKPVADMKWQYSPAYYFLGASYMYLGNFDEARDLFEQSLRITPSVWPEIYGLLSTVYRRDHDTTRASMYEKKFLGRAQERGDSLWVAYADLGGILSEQGFSNESIGYYRMAATIRPGIAEYHDSLAVLFYRQGDFDGAMKECMQTLQLDSTASDPYYFLAKIYEMRGDKGNALSNYRAYMRNDSMSARANEVKELIHKSH